MTGHDDTTHGLSHRALSYSSDTIRVPVRNKNGANLVAKLQKNCSCCAIILIGISCFMPLSQLVQCCRHSV